MRGMCSTVLFFEAILIGLAAPVMIAIEDVQPSLALWLCGVLAVLCLIAIGMLRSPWGYALGHVLQLAAIALGLLAGAMYFVGGLFAVLWFGAFALGRRIEADKARWAAEAN